MEGPHHAPYSRVRRAQGPGARSENPVRTLQGQDQRQDHGTSFQLLEEELAQMSLGMALGGYSA